MSGTINHLYIYIKIVRVLCASAVRVGVCGGCVCLGALKKKKKKKNYLSM